jgi:hypothetical protein
VIYGYETGLVTPGGNAEGGTAGGGTAGGEA